MKILKKVSHLRKKYSYFLDYQDLRFSEVKYIYEYSPTKGMFNHLQIHVLAKIGDIYFRL